MDIILQTLNVISYVGGLGFAGLFTWFLVEKNLERFTAWRAERRGTITPQRGR